MASSVTLLIAFLPLWSMTFKFDIKHGVCVKSITSDFWTREEGARLEIVVSYFLFSSCFPLMRETDSKNSQVHLVPA